MDSRVRAVVWAPTPTDVTQVKSFMGMLTRRKELLSGRIGGASNDLRCTQISQVSVASTFQDIHDLKPLFGLLGELKTARFCRRIHELSCEVGCILWDTRVILPTVRRSMLTELQSCQVELSVMREISLLQYVKRGRNICKTRSALPEVAKQPRMLGGSGGMPPEMRVFVIENAKYVISCLFRLYLTPMTLRK